MRCRFCPKLHIHVIRNGKAKDPPFGWPDEMVLTFGQQVAEDAGEYYSSKWANGCSPIFAPCGDSIRVCVDSFIPPQNSAEGLQTSTN